MIHNSQIIFDSHTHVHFPAYDQDRDVVVKRAQEAGVKMITVGTNLQTSKEAIAIAEKYPEDIWATVGFHPTHISESPSEAQKSEGRTSQWYYDKNELRQPIQEKFYEVELRKISSHPRVVAIGECGLDYYRIKNDELGIKKRQKEFFLEQVEIAKDLKKPLMIHCRPSKGTDDAYEDLLNALSSQDLTALRRRLIMHFFVGSLPIAKKLLEAGCCFTFGGVITFVRDYDEVIKYLPLESILLETDAPYVAPEPYRGKRNEPAYVVEVAKKIAETKNISLEEVINTTTSNNKKLFDLIF